MIFDIPNYYQQKVTVKIYLLERIIPKEDLYGWQFIHLEDAIACGIL